MIEKQTEADQASIRTSEKDITPDLVESISESQVSEENERNLSLRHQMKSQVSSFDQQSSFVKNSSEKINDTVIFDELKESNITHKKPEIDESVVIIPKP